MKILLKNLELKLKLIYIVKDTCWSLDYILNCLYPFHNLSSSPPTSFSLYLSSSSSRVMTACVMVLQMRGRWFWSAHLRVRSSMLLLSNCIPTSSTRWGVSYMYRLQIFYCLMHRWAPLDNTSPVNPLWSGFKWLSL